MFKKILFGVSALALFSACTEDFKDWAEPQANQGVTPKSVAMTIAPAQSAAIDLGSVESETVKLFSVTLPEGVTAESFNVKLTDTGNNTMEANYPDYNVTADANGNVSVADLQAATNGMFNMEAVERTFNALVSTNVTVEGTTGSAAVALAAEPFVVTVIPQAPEYNQFVYFIGATDGWANPDQRLESPAGDGVYTGYVYIADPNGWGVEFKFQKVAGDWGDDSQLNSNNVNEVTGDFEKTGDNFKASAGEGVYFVTLDLVKNTLDGLKVNMMGIIGDFNGWGGDVEMTWNATDFCYEVTDAPVNANGWKFRVNSDWGINLGSNDSVEPSTVLNDLVANGKNIGVAGTTIKLYPTRKTSDKIFCTVE